jgi:4-alpha-glucanotransferase
VTAGDVEEFVARHPFWSGEWVAFAGAGALADQVRFEREWTRIRRHSAERDVRILGDMSFYVAAGSADHLRGPELFRAGVVSGVPPDDWSATGQLWGTPVYDWSAHRRQGYGWWIERFRRTFELVDAARVDHFRAFVAAWVIPERNRTALAGHWTPGPGRRVFDAASAALGSLPLVAENLGVITPAVERLRHALGLPGTIVLQFAFAERSVNRRRAWPGRHDLVYTGTHDNDTTVGWWRGASEPVRRAVRVALAEHDLTENEPNWMLIRLALESPAAISIVPAQDLLGLGSRARTNRPGQARGNWRWRLPDGALDRALASRLRDATEASGRA